MIRYQEIIDKMTPIIKEKRTAINSNAAAIRIIQLEGAEFNELFNMSDTTATKKILNPIKEELGIDSWKEPKQSTAKPRRNRAEILGKVKQDILNDLAQDQTYSRPLGYFMRKHCPELRDVLHLEKVAFLKVLTNEEKAEFEVWHEKRQAFLADHTHGHSKSLPKGYRYEERQVF